MPASACFRVPPHHPRLSRVLSFSSAFLLLACAVLCSAASIRGVVTDASGAKVTGANVILVCQR